LLETINFGKSKYRFFRFGKGNNMKDSAFKPEISFDNGVPLAPNVAPVILLQGSDYQMGYQYAQQLCQLFGSWALERLKRNFNKKETGILRAYQVQLEKHAPEFIDMFQGIADGAASIGIDLTPDEVMADDCMSFHIPPVYRGLGRQQTQSGSPPSSGCSGFAAWGTATKDGRLICSGSGDHPLSHEALIAVLPDTGNGYITRMGVPTFSIHPAMNNKGLAYAHHGAGSAGKDSSNQGINGTLVVRHTLRFANSVEKALAMQLTYPQGSQAAGLWADINGKAGILECRDPQTVRRAGDYEEKDFLYATNNSLVPDLKPFLDNVFGWDLTYVPHGGWNLDDFNSVRRNLCIWNALHNYHGKVDLDFAKMLWRFPSRPPEYSSLEEADLKLSQTRGLGWDVHIGNLGNGMVGIMLPDNGDKGLYYACVGPAGRKAEPLTTGWHFYHIAATHTFFELQLAPKPEFIVAAAKKRAQYDLYYANKELRKLTYHDIPYAPLDAIFDKAAAENQKGDYYLVLAQKTKGNESTNNYAKAVRAFTRCQAYARQVYESLVPPADKPTDLGLGEWFGSWGEWET
jgi:hypothetical protein